MRRFGRLLGFLKPYRVIFVLSGGAALAFAALDGFALALLIPFLRVLFEGVTGLPELPTFAERVIDIVAGGFVDTGERATALRNVVLLVLGSIALKNAASFTAEYLGASVREHVARDLRTTMHAHLHALGLGYFRSTKTGQLVSRAVADADQATGIVSSVLVATMQNAVLAGVYLFILFSLSWRLSLVTLTLAPLIVLVLRPILLGFRARIRTALDDRGELSAVMTESIEGARQVKAHGAEAYERRRFGQVADRYLAGVLRARRLAALASPLSETLGAAVILLLLMGSWSANPEGLRPEVFLTFVVVSLRLLRPVKFLSQFPAMAEQSLAAADRVFEIVDVPPDDVDAPGAPHFPGLQREILFDNVWVAYEPGRWVLRGVNLTVQRGEVVAIVGPSGAGKSTLADLLPRFVEPRRGGVLVDGVPVSAYSRRSVRRAMGIVSQHTVIFNDTVRANIAYGDDADAPDEAVTAAARAANAHAFIECLPDGYDTVLGERGMRLSGGERQRIAIARALLRDPPIVILDEATSSLDAESEQLVQGAIGRLLANRTVLVIAHRLSTVAQADLIVVMDDGRLVEHGRHGELISAGGLYQRLHTLEPAGWTR